MSDESKPDGNTTPQAASDEATSTAPANSDESHDLDGELQTAIARRQAALRRAQTAEAERDALKAKLESLQPHADAWRQHQTANRLSEATKGVADEHKDAFVELLRTAADADGVDLVDGDMRSIESLAQRTLERFPGFKARPKAAPQPGVNMGLKGSDRNRLLGG